MKKLFLVIFFLIAIITGCSKLSEKTVIIQNDFFSYEISADGTNLHFTDRLTGNDYISSESPSKCAYVIVDGEKFDVTAVSLDNNVLKMEFGGANASAETEIITGHDRITFRVSRVNGEIKALTFLNVPLSLEAQPYEPFGACALSMNLFTHVRRLPPLQSELWATCYSRFGLEDAEITLLGLPQDSILPVIRDVMSGAKDIPFSDAGGAWALMKKEGLGSYLMNFGTLTESTVDEWIDRCHSLGFNQIDSHGGGAFFEFGTLELNEEKWPDGWESFKRINAKLHEAGISHIFHTYAFFIDKKSRYVTPVPSNDLGYVRTFTLKEPLAETSDEMVVNESTENISTITGFHTENSVTLKIGSELIEFSGITKSPPYKFTGLKRGANGTKVASHKSGDTAFHMSERFGRFVPGPEADLFNEIARRHAQIVNDCEFDGIYFDAIDGSAVLGGEENFWYYGTKFIFEVVKNLKRPVGMEMSSMSHHWWHYRSRWQAWDRAVRGYKRFIDIHLASVKASAYFLPENIRSNEWEHGLWRGHSPLIDKFAGVEKGQILLPLHLGWWGNQTWAPPQIEPTFSDDIEYLGCKMIGNDAGFSQLGGVDDETLDKFPLFRQSSEILKQYEELRHKNYFDEDVKRILRQPGKEFTLFRQDDGTWNFKPVLYQKHKITGLDDSSATWSIDNEFDVQPLKLRLELLMSVKPYSDPANVALADFSQSPDFVTELAADGVSGEISRIGEKTPDGEATAVFSAKNNGKSPVDGSYLNMAKNFDPLADLSNNQALGFWVKGDGSGQLLNLSLRSPVHISHGAHGDHFVKIDFTGWKYFELVEIESAAISDYIWPDDSHFYVYDSYRHQINFRNIEKFQLWYNNIPEGKEVSCHVGPVKAIPMIQGVVENPAVMIGNEKVVFPVRMESGMYLEVKGEGDCRLYGSKGELIKEVKTEGKIPELIKGKNMISVSGQGNDGINTRLQVTVISEGNPL